MRHTLARLVPLTLATALVPGVGAQQAEAPPAAVEQLIAREQARTAVEQALELYQQRADNGAEEVDNFNRAVRDLVDVGPEVVPFLTNELNQDLQASYFFAAFALGHFESPEADAALREAMQRADRDGGDFALVRKAWAGYALALMGRPEAVDLFNEGRHLAGHVPIHSGMSVLEAAAFQTAPDCVPLLLAQLDRFAEDEELASERVQTLQALGRIADTSAVPRLLRVLQEPGARMRREAARALGTMNTAESVQGLIAALEDEDSRVRMAAASSLESILPANRLKTFADRLETEETSVVRGVLYRLVARLGGASASEILRRHQGRSDPNDHFFLSKATALIVTPHDLDSVRAMLSDRDNRVVALGVKAAAALGTRAGIDLLIDALRSPSWPLVQMSLEQLVDKDETRAASVIAERLVKVELSGMVTDPRRRSRIDRMTEALVSLRHVAPLADLQRAAQEQTDAVLLESLDSVIRRLTLLKKNGKNVGRWLELLQSSAGDERSLSYRRLGGLGGKRAAEGLAARFGRVPAEEGLEILRELGRIDSEPSRALIRRTLLAPEFDGITRLPLREMAAWGARRIGGPEMFDALVAAVERRDGQDARVMIYLALTGGDRALPTLAEYRARRMRYLKWTRGKEQIKLDWIAREIAAGRSIEALDLPPERLVFR